MTQLTILGTNIRQDANGRYSLGDCWQLSGKDPKNKPSEWYSATKTQDFLVVLEGERGSPLTSAGEPENGITHAGDRGSPVTPVSVVKTGPNEGRGYWANREAVIHYATWINPEFYLKVIRAFDEAERSKFNLAPPAIDLNDPAFLRQTLLGYTEKVIALEAEVSILSPKAERLDILAKGEGDVGVQDAGRVLGVGQTWVVNYVLDHDWACRQKKRLKAAHYGLSKGYVRACSDTYIDRYTGETKVRDDFKITRKGIDRLAEIIVEMKKANDKVAEMKRAMTPSREMELH